MIVDVHSHLAPAVDDGAESIEEALLALKALELEGVGVVVTTPHLLLPYLDSRAAVSRELDRHRRAFDSLAIAAAASADRLPALGLGQEIWAPDAGTFRRAAGLPGLRLGAGDYLLVEFGFELRGDHRDVIDAVLEAGYRIVIAHPERYTYPEGFEPLATAAGWREAGALLQVNAGSLGGHYVRSSPRSGELAWRFVEDALADLIATDHHASNRPVSVREAWNLLAERRGSEVATRLMEDTPARLLQPQALAGAAGGHATT
jgi:protein-tyrosine phosphatase